MTALAGTGSQTANSEYLAGPRRSNPFLHRRMKNQQMPCREGDRDRNGPTEDVWRGCAAELNGACG
ncbi:hypothetical protein PGT21_033400 [Puccinia graminis f. sp. tritici]|uniref:Uncharacterized protein n=1 Tax=Puccinia graminis f. sp. tritici TaxID=56615 RepID=A0A5B0P398_PUCGR|nr:hypothetical protein PGTUg99_012681 [Puccinia graminis f. sp. tritici]KAA1094950.1 hypothetical protein PGT21_033400 [Puccinia graminis f. sp. tritici]